MAKSLDAKMDNPSCPQCGHYNAMLGISESPSKVVRECRDCGHRTTEHMIKNGLIIFEFEGSSYQVAKDVGYTTQFIGLPDGRVLKAGYDGRFEPPIPTVFELVGPSSSKTVPSYVATTVMQASLCED
jgi:hypothetical protein